MYVDVSLAVIRLCIWFFFFFFKQKTAYEMRISDWSSDVCSSDLSDDKATFGGGFGKSGTARRDWDRSIIPGHPASGRLRRSDHFERERRRRNSRHQPAGRVERNGRNGIASWYAMNGAGRYWGQRDRNDVG